MGPRQSKAVTKLIIRKSEDSSGLMHVSQRPERLVRLQEDPSEAANDKNSAI